MSVSKTFSFTGAEAKRKGPAMRMNLFTIVSQSAIAAILFCALIVGGLSSCAQRHAVAPSKGPLDWSSRHFAGVQSADGERRKRLVETFGQLPLYFVKNEGQLDKKVKFYEKGHGHAVYFTEEGVTFSLPGKGGRKDRQANAQVNLVPLGMSKEVEIVPLDPQHGKMNFFIGNEPRKWRANVPSYGAVLYRNAYPGIDLKFYGKSRQLEYDIIIKGDADLSQVRFEYVAEQSLTLLADGGLLVPLPDGGGLLQRKPKAYQEIEGTRVERAVRFKLISCDDGYWHSQTSPKKWKMPDMPTEKDLPADRMCLVCGFEVDEYNPEYPLVIDPVLEFSTFLGGTGGEAFYSSSIAIDQEGNIYIAGETDSSDFPMKNPISPILSGCGDVFVTKLSRDGSALIYSTYLGGSDYQDPGPGPSDPERLGAIAVDATGNVYIAGSTSSSDFPTKDPLFPQLESFRDAFVAKIASDGSALVYSTYLGGDNGDFATSIAVDAGGNAYVAGETCSSNFPTRNALFPENVWGDNDAFIAKINANGSALVYSTYLGGSSSDSGSSITVDVDGNVVIVGSTTSPDFPTKDPLFANLGGLLDCFVAKINADGSKLIYSTFLGGSNEEAGAPAVALDADGNAYVTGTTRSADFPTKNPIFPDLQIGLGFFVTKLNSTGSSLVYSSLLDGGHVVHGGGPKSIAVDQNGNAYITGETYSYDFPTKDPLFARSAHSEAFITKINSSGTALQYSTYLGGQGEDRGSSIAVDSFGTACVTGFTTSSDFPTKNPLYPNLWGETDAFVLKITDSDFPEPTITNRVICGYQGWFRCEGDGSPIDKHSAADAWMHWSETGPPPSKGFQTFELYPDVSMYPKRSLFKTGYAKLGDGKPARLFTSYSNAVVNRHFSWMKNYGIDGVALQRFGGGVREPLMPDEGFPDKHFYADDKNGMAKKVRRAAERYGRLFYIMYDISGMSVETYLDRHITEFKEVIKQDWEDWLASPNRLNLISSPMYAKESGKPVVCIYGIGFWPPMLINNNCHIEGEKEVCEKVTGTPDQFVDLINWFKSKGCYVVGGVPKHWRTGGGDASDGFLDVYNNLNMICPWNVGRYSTDEEIDAHRDQFLIPDKDYCASRGIAYQPVMFPGFAWSNWHEGGHRNEIPRRRGNFFWRQAFNIRKAGIRTAYIAMFDEYDEGTAIAKAAEDSSMIPTDQYFLTLSADGAYISSDFYLRLAGKSTRMIKKLDPKVKKVPIPFSTGPVLFRTSLEKYTDASLSWTDSIDDTGGGVANVTGLGGNGKPECGIVSGEHSKRGTFAIRCAGRDTSRRSSYCYFKVVHVDIPITHKTKLRFWIRPQSPLGRYISIDLIMTDGTTLRDAGAVDYNGVSMHPSAGRGTLRKWEEVRCNIGEWLEGKRIDRIVVAYDHPAQTGDFRGYIDDLLITDGRFE